MANQECLFAVIVRYVLGHDVSTITDNISSEPIKLLGQLRHKE